MMRKAVAVAVVLRMIPVAAVTMIPAVAAAVAAVVAVDMSMFLISKAPMSVNRLRSTTEEPWMMAPSSILPMIVARPLTSSAEQA